MGRALSELTRYGLPIVAGAMFPLGLAPFDVWIAIPASSGLLLLALHVFASRSSFLTGWLYGAGLFMAGASWVYVSIKVYGHAPAPLAAFLTAVFCLGQAVLFGVLSYCYGRWLKPSDGRVAVWGFTGLWVLFEWLRSWLLTGFPWLYGGYAALDTSMAGWAPVVGVFGLSFWLVALGATGMALIVSTQRPWLVLQLTLLAVLGATGEWLGRWAWTQPTGESLAVALYQPNIPLEQKWDRRYRRQILAQYQAATDPLYVTHDVVLWPESALPALRSRVADYLEEAALKARSHNTALITGIAVRGEQGLHNSIIAMGQGDGIHHKQKLVPFGEYVPLEHWLRGLIAFFDLPMSSFTKSNTAHSLLTAGPHRVAPFICYEVVYPDFVTDGAKDSHWLVTVSNDSWFGDSIGPLQHLQMARFGALATERPMLRGTNNGVSAIIDHRGQLIETSEQFIETTLTGELQPRQGTTPIMTSGSWPTLLLATMVIIITRWRHIKGTQVTA